MLGLPDPSFYSFQKQKKYVVNIGRHVGFSNVFIVSPVGLSGGLVIMWIDECDVNLLSLSTGHIDVSVNWDLPLLGIILASMVIHPTRSGFIHGIYCANSIRSPLFLGLL